MADASTQSQSVEFQGFANAPRKKDGTLLDFRKVKGYVDKSEEGKRRLASQTAVSSIVQHKTEGTGTNGPPAAVVGKAPTETATGKSKGSDSDSSAAEGEGANAG